MGKVCCTCGQTLPLESFNRDRGKKDGRGSQCRECKKIVDTQYRKDNKEAIAEGKARHYQNNREKVDSHNRKYCEDHKESIAKYQAQYGRDNKERLSEMAAQRYENDKERVKKRAKKYYQDNRESVLEHHVEYYQDNKGAAFAYAVRRKALKIDRTPVDANIKKIQFYYDVCVETNEILGGAFFHVDHIQPLSKGGLHHEDNLQILESFLNLQKNSKWPLSDEDWAKYRGVTL